MEQKETIQIDEIDMINGIVELKDKCVISLQLAHFSLHGIKKLEQQLVQLPFHLLCGTTL